jgi:hypothetical protein
VGSSHLPVTLPTRGRVRDAAPSRVSQETTLYSQPFRLKYIYGRAIETIIMTIAMW